MLRRGGDAGGLHPLVHSHHRCRRRLLCRGRHCAGGHEGQRPGAPHSVTATDR
jgi:hypothetical protein